MFFQRPPSNTSQLESDSQFVPVNDPSQVPQVDSSKLSPRMPSARERRRWKQLENLAKASKVFYFIIITYLLTSLPTYLPTSLFPHLPTCLPTSLPTYLPPSPPTYLPTYLPPHLPTYLPLSPSTYLPSAPPTYRPLSRPTYCSPPPPYLPAYLFNNYLLFFYSCPTTNHRHQVAFH